MMEQQKLQTEQEQIDPKLLAKLSSKKAEEREQAESAIQALGPQAVEALLATLKKEAKKRRLTRNWVIGGICALYGMMFLIAFVVYWRTGHFESSFFSSFGGMSGAFAGAAAISQLSKNSAKQLSKYDDVRVVGPLSEAITWDDKEVRNMAADGLKRLLPRLQATDAGLFTEEQRGCLYSVIKPGRARKEPELALAVLRALEQVGDARAAEMVEHLANMPEKKPVDKRLIEAARESLPAVQQRAEMARAAERLLRPAEAVGPDVDILLRPAEGAGEADSARLLRPSEPGTT